MNPAKNIKKESPLISILFNIFIPVLILKNGNNWIFKTLVYFKFNLQESSIINLSSVTFLIALAFPITYFIYDFFKRKNFNLISILGFINVLLTGGIGVFGAKFGLSKNWFVFKEGFLPLVIGFLLLIMKKYRQDSFNKILLNEALFDNYKIKNSIKEEKQNEFEKLLGRASAHFILGLFISSIIQFILASIIVVSNPGEPSFNDQVATMTWVSYFAVLVPTMLVVGKGYWELIVGIEKITDIKKEDFLKT